MKNFLENYDQKLFTKNNFLKAINTKTGFITLFLSIFFIFVSFFPISFKFAKQDYVSIHSVLEIFSIALVLFSELDQNIF